MICRQMIMAKICQITILPQMDSEMPILQVICIWQQEVVNNYSIFYFLKICKKKYNKPYFSWYERWRGLDEKISIPIPKN